MLSLILCSQNSHTYTRRRLPMRSEPSRFSETEKVYKRPPSLGKRFYISKGVKLAHTNYQQSEYCATFLGRVTMVLCLVEL
jgi:hypothetical protein